MMPASGGRVTAGDDLLPRPVRRAPAVPVAAAVALGIVFDANCLGGFAAWLTAATLCLMGGFAALVRQPGRLSASLFLGAAVCLGGGWHHVRWSLTTAHEAAQYATDISQPVHLVGQLVDEPTIVPRKDRRQFPGMPEYDRTICTLACQNLISGQQTLPATGMTRLEVSGHLLNVHVDDLVAVCGRVARPSVARNPGGFDFRRYLRAAGINTVVRCGEPEGVHVVRAGNRGGWRRWQARLRAESERIIDSRLSSETAAVGVALLLGTRTSMSDELRTAFAESGTTHILAISGANIAFLAGIVWFVCRLVGLARTPTVATVLVAIVGYAFVADAQPPVVRAVLMISVILLGMPWYRGTSVVNALALAVVGVLVWNPMHLFDIGAQLSFLAVGALVWAPRWLRQATRPGDPASLPLPGERGPASIGLSWCIRTAAAACMTMASIWLFTMPLTMARFHLFSLAGFFVNVALAPLVAAVLSSGYLLLLCGWVAPALAAPCAWAFDWGLRAMVWVVSRAGAAPGGHWYGPGPEAWWLAGFYAGLAGVVGSRPKAAWGAWSWRFLLLWTVVGLAAARRPAPTDELVCTFLSMGHGAATLLELPGGQTLLYDAGQLQDGLRAQQSVQGVMWSRGLTRLDAIVVSHADIDHFNGIPLLLRSVPAGCVLAHPSFLDFRQAGVRHLCAAAEGNAAPLKLVWQGDRLRLDDQVVMRVLHPPVRSRSSRDNANSVVLCIEYAGRRILLTGDLEGDGLAALLRTEPLACDALLAPHHGSLAANTRGLAAWARPQCVVVSAGRNAPLEKLQTVYGPAAQILSTHDRGAITFRIAASGMVRYDCFLDRGQSGVH